MEETEVEETSESSVVRGPNRADAWRKGGLTRLRGCRLMRKRRRCEAGIGCISPNSAREAANFDAWPARIRLLDLVRR